MVAQGRLHNTLRQSTTGAPRECGTGRVLLGYVRIMYLNAGTHVHGNRTDSALVAARAKYLSHPIFKFACEQYAKAGLILRS